MFCEIVVESASVIRSVSLARTMFQFPIPFFLFFFFSISQSFKTWMCFKPVEPDGHHYISFILWVCK